VRLDAPTFAAAQDGDPGGKLVLFAKLVDVAPDGTETLPRNQLAAVRVGDVTQPVEITLPGVVHRFARGHQVRLVLSSSNATNRGNAAGGPVTVRLDPADPATLTLPELGAAGATGSGPNGTTPYAPPAGSPPAARAARPTFARTASATLPRARSCASRRAFTIRLRRAPKGDRIRSADVRLNGRRLKVLRGTRLRSTVSLRGLPRGTFRVTVTVRTRKGKVLRSARTYRTCVGRGR
jgi:hypothetical protein